MERGSLLTFFIQLLSLDVCSLTDGFVSFVVIRKGVNMLLCFHIRLSIFLSLF